MSIRFDWLHNLLHVLFRERCAVCGKELSTGERTICTLCRATAPLTGYWEQPANPVLERCRDLLPIHRASGFLFFRRGAAGNG